MLIIFGGLPGSGKTTLAQGLARQLGAVYLRIDTIEQVLLASGAGRFVDETGYLISYAVAEDNLRLGRTVVADSVNPLKVTRDAWRDAAKRAGVTSVDVLVVCSDQVEHRRRIETRNTGFRVVTWQDVLTREFEPLDSQHVAIDTAGQSVEQSLNALRMKLDRA